MGARGLFVVALLLVAWACRPDGSRADSPTGAVASEAPAVLVTKPAPLQIAGPVQAPAPGPVRLEILPQFDAVHAPGPTPLHVLVRMTGLGTAAAERAPLDLVLVIDRSGSMSGEKIRAVKEAALGLLGRLDERDRVTLVSYASDVRVHRAGQALDAFGREALRRDVLSLHAAGNTALGPALFTGLDLLERGDRADSRMAHVLLLSDGLANEGERRPEALAARAGQAFLRGISVSTLGVGLDYHEDLMTKVADQGGGRYHFVRDSAAIPGVVGDELDGLARTLARGVELYVSPGTGVRVERVFGYASDADALRTRIRVGAVAAGQTREILLRLQVQEGGASGLSLGRFDLRMRDVAAGGAERAFAIEPLVARAADASAMRASENAAVTVRLAEVESAERLEVAARASESGRFDDARRVLQDTLGEMRERQRRAPSPKLQKSIQMLEQAEGEVSGASAGGEAQKAFTKKYKADAYESMK